MNENTKSWIVSSIIAILIALALAVILSGLFKVFEDDECREDEFMHINGAWMFYAKGCVKCLYLHDKTTITNEDGWTWEVEKRVSDECIKSVKEYKELKKELRANK